MSKVFGYPEYDEKGEKILTTYDNEYKAMMMDIRVYRMKAGETRTFLREGEETAVLLLSGNITYKWNGNEATATRKDVFTEGPWCVHGCTGTEITVVANAESQILVQCTKNEKDFGAKLYKPEDAPWGYSCVGKFGNVAKRRVNTIFDHDISPESNMVLGERSSMTEETGPDTCRTDIRSLRHTSSNLTIRKDSEQALSVIRYLRVQTRAFPQFREESFIRRQLHLDIRCTHAG